MKLADWQGCNGRYRATTDSWVVRERAPIFVTSVTKIGQYPPQSHGRDGR